MASEWQSKLTRVSRMEWAEVRTRAAQEFDKRRDLLLHQIGVRAGTLRLSTDSGLRSGEFFFSGNERAGRVDLLRRHLPGEAAAILREADEICDHRFRLLGYENLNFSLNGNAEIDWHLDPVHAKRAPIDAWFRIPFLDFDAVGDHKVIWELNRHQHLVTLAKARLLSGDEKYVLEIAAQWRSWMEANPYPLGINWASTLEVAFRSLSWIWVDHLLAGTAEYERSRAEILGALAFHGRYIERYLSTYFSPNTHLLGEAVALFFLGTHYPQFPNAERWRKSSWKIVLHEAERQVLADGVYFEQSLYYHVYALDFFLYARWLAGHNGLAIPPSYDAMLLRMLDVIAALAQAGPAEGFGDDDGGRVFNARRNRTEHMTDPLALGAVMYSRTFPAARLTEEAIWLFGKQAVEKFADPVSGATARPAPARSVAFADGGIYVLADSESCSSALMVDAGPQGAGRSGHGHADALSLRLTMDGQRWLVDSGTGVYVSNDPNDRYEFRGTRAHNTLCVDGADQAVADGPFAWTNIPIAQAEKWIAGKTFTYFAGSHNGYARLEDPVVHRRQILRVAGGLTLVRDLALGRSEHDLEIRWHFEPDLKMQKKSGGVIEVSTEAGQETGASRLTLVVPETPAWQMLTEVTKLSPCYGALQTASSVRCYGRLLLPAETATVLIPAVDAAGQRGATLRDESSVEPRLSSARIAAVQTYELKYHDQNESHGFFFTLGDEEWSCGPWSSDATLLYCLIQNEKLRQFVVVGGSFVRWQGQLLLKAGKPAEFFEWRAQDATTSLSAGEFRATDLFKELEVGSHSFSSNQTASEQRTSPYAEKR